MNSAEIACYKLTIIKALVSDQEIISLIDSNGEFEYPDDMIYERIFPFDRIPDTEQEAKTYITISVNVPSINKKNDLVKDLIVTARAITHASLMKVKGQNGTRIDLLAARLDTILNERSDLGIGPVSLVSNCENALDKAHFYRELKFKTMDLNNRRYGA